ncbi:hypothetical protein AMS68_000828 [Peltaster fructicola]|uniref:Aprataxin-like protein n=1 Tax=Peltaster fructicola TaxID=286661 RepID=A0A6H0XL02_9PEZI|nr:hypothetical protein AMS68_000828 [Peltaster fructicola]
MMSSNRATADDLEDGCGSTTPSQQNAFTKLMTPKAKPHTDKPTKKTTFYGADGLGVYIADPASFPASRVVYYNDKFVVINDLYPKASVHLLILPRDRSKNYLEPQVAFDDSDFLAECQKELVKVRKIVADELRRRFGEFSKSDREYFKAIEAEEPPSSLPAGRDWSKDVISGIHANPSMNHVHIHVLSRDMVSECMKKTNHYFSFTTDFLVDLDQFPLAKHDHRRSASHYMYFPSEMTCWRCGKQFGNKITKLKAHLEEELQSWIKE